MTEILDFLRGKKTYIVAFVAFVYGFLAYVGIVPEPESFTTTIALITAFAVTFRSAIKELIDVFVQES